MKKERLVVICPGRGSYTKENLGGLKKYRPRHSEFLNQIDDYRRSLGQVTLAELDSESSFRPQLHTLGEHASAMIFAYSYCDFLDLNSDQYEIVAVTGNSMGWYTALAAAQVLKGRGAFEVVNTMGSMMKDQLIGGQIIYPIVNESWQIQSEILDLVKRTMAEAKLKIREDVWISIRLGGYLVIGGSSKALDYLLKNLPKTENYPFQLINHGAFHTPLMSDISSEAFSQLSLELFHAPRIPLIDGQGRIWSEWSTDVEEIYHYTLSTQVLDLYDFSQALTVALKEFCPDRLVLLGPGGSLGGAIGQILVENQWQGMKCKADFVERQKSDSFLLSPGRP